MRPSQTFQGPPTVRSDLKVRPLAQSEVSRVTMGKTGVPGENPYLTTAYTRSDLFVSRWDSPLLDQVVGNQDERSSEVIFFFQRGQWPQLRPSQTFQGPPTVRSGLKVRSLAQSEVSRDTMGKTGVPGENPYLTTAYTRSDFSC